MFLVRLDTVYGKEEAIVSTRFLDSTLFLMPLFANLSAIVDFEYWLAALLFTC